MVEEKEEFEEEHEELGADDLLYEAHLKVDALIELLIKKKIITEEEYDETYEKLLQEDMEESEAEEKSKES